MQEPEVFQKQGHFSNQRKNAYTQHDKGDITGHFSACHIKDHVDRVIEGWQQERPDLNVASIAIITRMERLQSYMRAEVNAVFERFGLTGPSFAVLATLRRAGKPYQLSQRALVDALQLTGGTISVRIDRLERDGYVVRIPDPYDQRGVLVRLTEAGERLFEQVVPIHLANEERLLSALSPQQQEQLASLLHILLFSFEAARQNGYHPVRLLGASLAPAHVARKLQHASGLPDRVGLLIECVEASGLAARSGLQEGDLIVAANGKETRTIEDLCEQLWEARGQTIMLDVFHGVSSRCVVLHVDTPLTPE